MELLLLDWLEVIHWLLSRNWSLATHFVGPLLSYDTRQMLLIPMQLRSLFEQLVVSRRTELRVQLHGLRNDFWLLQLLGLMVSLVTRLLSLCQHRI